MPFMYNYTHYQAISIIQKLDKGNSIAIIDKSDYLEKTRNISSDFSKFTKVSVT